MRHDNEHNKVRKPDWIALQSFDRETVLCFKLTRWQATVLLSQTEYLGWSTRWNNLPQNVDIVGIRDEIEYQLMNPKECTDMTFEEYCEAIRCGILKATPEIGLALSGALNSDISWIIGDDGLPIIDEGGEDTGQDQTDYEIRDGQAHYIYNRILEFIQDYEDFFGIFPTSEANTITFFQNKYLLNAGIAQAVSDYYAHRQGMNIQPQPPDDGLIERFWCEGFTKQVTATYIIDDVVNDQLLLLSMLDALTQEQYDQWAIEGVVQPRDEYLSYGCYPLPDVTGSIIDPVQNNSQQWASVAGYASLGHTRLFRITVSGKLTTTDGRLVDFMYLKDLNNNVSLSNWTNARWTVGGNFPVEIVRPTNLPYSDTGDYSWIFSMPSANYSQFETRNVESYMNGITGTITFKFEDLLEVQ